MKIACKHESNGDQVDGCCKLNLRVICDTTLGAALGECEVPERDQLRDLAREMFQDEGGVVLKDRKWMGMKYPSCFTGTCECCPRSSSVSSSRAPIVRPHSGTEVLCSSCDVDVCNFPRNGGHNCTIQEQKQWTGFSAIAKE